MPVIERPKQIFNFSDWARSHPREAPPGDRLDAQFTALMRAIESTQVALADLRRDDGGLRNKSVGTEQLDTSLINDLIGGISEIIDPIEARVRGVAEAALSSERSAGLFAQDAERAVTVAQQLASGLTVLRNRIDMHIDYIQQVAGRTGTEADDAENWANYSKAMSDNATAAMNEALAWAEYLAGPVVDGAKAPAYIAGSPYPHGLYYQPVEGGVAGLWSAKWWALEARNIVGAMGSFYLGASDTPPLPGEVNPGTGQVTPPIKPGSIYIDTAVEPAVLKVWDGSQWIVPVSLTASYTARFVYHATAGQTVFSGADFNGQTPAVGASPSEVHLNGVMLVPTEDYTIAANALTLLTPVTAGSIVQWDLMVPPSALAPGAVTSYKLTIAPAPDGTAQDFTLTYTNPSTGLPAATTVGNGSQLLISLDGVVQEPGVSYTASGSTLHFAEAPVATAMLWGVWYKPGA